MSTAMMPSSSTTPQSTADRLISLSRQQEGGGVSDSLQGIIGDILRALEADGIYQAGPVGLPCSTLSVKTVCSVNLPQMTFVHVVTDMAMLSLLRDLPEEAWLLYIRGQWHLDLSYQAMVAIQETSEAGGLNTGLAEYGYYSFATDNYTHALLPWGPYFNIS